MKIKIVTGSICNNACRFCSLGRRRESKSTRFMKEEIDMACAEAPDELNFTGGEPTIRKDIEELISYANGKFRDVTLTTNGRMLSYAGFTKRLSDAGLTGAIFSVHSHVPSIHDYLTSTKGCFEQVTKGMENLAGCGGKISVNTVITSLNCKSLPELGEMLLKYGVKSLCLIYPTVDGNLLKNPELLPRFSDVKAVETIKLMRDHGVMAWALNIPTCLLPGFEDASSIMKMETKVYWNGMRTDLDVKKYEGKTKPAKCSSCSIFDVCPGMSEKYAERYGSDEVNPIGKDTIVKY